MRTRTHTHTPLTLTHTVGTLRSSDEESLKLCYASKCISTTGMTVILLNVEILTEAQFFTLSKMNN